MTPQPEDYPTDEAFVRAYYKKRLHLHTGSGSFRYHDIWVDCERKGKTKCIGSSQKLYHAWQQAATHVKKELAVRERAPKTYEFLLRLKRKPCKDCRKTYPHYVMEFDHVRGVKHFSICTGWKKHSIQVVKEELRKCELVCSNCHRIRTFSRLHALKIVKGTNVPNDSQTTESKVVVIREFSLGS